MSRTEESGGTVLVVEDDADCRWLMGRLLAMSGYRIVEAGTGAEAVEVAGRERPDVILMDLSLPGVDGLEATRLIRQLEGMGDTPVVVLTGHDASRFHSAAKAVGCSEYVTKPVDYGLLEEVVGRLCAA